MFILNLQRSFYDYTSDYHYDYDYEYDYGTEKETGEFFKRRRKSKAPQDYDYEYDYDYDYDYDYPFEDDFCFSCAANVNLFVMDSLQNKSETSLTFPFLSQSLTFPFQPHKTHKQYVTLGAKLRPVNLRACLYFSDVLV